MMRARKIYFPSSALCRSGASSSAFSSSSSSSNNLMSMAAPSSSTSVPPRPSQILRHNNNNNHNSHFSNNSSVGGCDQRAMSSLSLSSLDVGTFVHESMMQQPRVQNLLSPPPPAALSEQQQQQLLMQRHQQELQQQRIEYQRRQQKQQRRYFDEKSSIACIKSLSSGSDAVRASRKTEEILRFVMTTSWDDETQTSPKKPTVAIYNAVLDCWANSGLPQASQKCEALLKEMELRTTKTTIAANVIRPDIITYNIVINALANEGNYLRAEEMLYKMLKKASHYYEHHGRLVVKDDDSSNSNSVSPPPITPDLQTVATVLKAYSRRRPNDNDSFYCVSERAEKCLKILCDHIPKLYRSYGLVNVHSSVECYNAVLRCWAKAAEDAGPESAIGSSSSSSNSRRKKTAGERAEALLREMMDDSTSKKNHEFEIHSTKPNSFSYNMVVDAYANEGNPYRAEDLYLEMMSRARENRNNNDIKQQEIEQQQQQPNETSLNTVLKAWANRSRVGDPRAPERAEAIMRWTIDWNSEASSSGGNGVVVKPTIVSYNTVLYCWALRGETDRAESILRELENPDILSYNTVMNAFAEAGDGSRAEALFVKMLEGCVRDQQHRQNDNAVVVAFGVRPDVQTFSTVIKAWSRSKDPAAPERAEMLLKQMEDMSSDCGHGNDWEKIRPNIVTYNTVLSSWARSGRPDAGERAESILEGMMMGKNAPDVVSFNIVLNCWAKSNHELAAERAEAILEGMLLEHQKSRQQRRSGGGELFPSPDIVSYNTVLNAWAKTGNWERAEKLFFERMLGSTAGGPGVKPDKKTIKIMLKAFDRSKHRNAAYQAKSFLERAQNHLSEAAVNEIWLWKPRNNNNKVKSN